MLVKSKSTIVVPRAREDVFDFATSNETFKKTLLPYGPIAGIVSGEILGGGPLEQGARRRMTLSDGVVLDEDILEHQRPVIHRYKWTTGLKPPFAWLVKSGEGCWTFTEVPDGTRIVWTYDFELRSQLGYPLAVPIVRLFERWQDRGLGRIRDAAASLPEPVRVSHTSAAPPA